MPRVDVMMDGGGAIGDSKTKDFFYTDSFGGCTAIYASTNDGLFGLYHLRSTIDAAPSVIPTAKDSNEPFREWIAALKNQAKGEPIHFQVGTPRYPGNAMDRIQAHPEIGMERYIVKLCAQNGIENYGITLMNMVGVKSIAANANGMVCYTRNDQPMKVQLAQYQSDESLLAHSGYNTQQCLTFIQTHPNIDHDGALLKTYQEKFDTEQRIKKQRELKAQMHALGPQPKDIEIGALRDPVFIAVAEQLAHYQPLAKASLKAESLVNHQYQFVQAIYDAVKSSDLEALTAIKKSPYFSEVAENDLLTALLKGVYTELGQLYSQAEVALTKINTLQMEQSQQMHDKVAGNQGAKATL